MALTTYSTGTVAVTTGGAVTVTGGIWSGTNVVAGDMISVDGGAAVLLSDVSLAAGQIAGWTGGAVSGKTYVVYQCSSLRFDDVQIAQDLQKQVAALNTEGFYIFVPSSATAPDPSLGDDGQYAFQATTGKLWVKESGLWSYLGIYKSFSLKGGWSSATAYAVGDVVSLSGASYVCILAHTNQTPPNATYWQLLASKGDDGGALVAPYTYGPGGTSGQANLNNPTSQKDSTVIDINNADARGLSFATVYASLALGTSANKAVLRVYKSSDQSKYLLFNVTALAAGSNFYSASVTGIGSSATNPFVTGDALVYAFSPVGDKGSVGATGPASLKPIEAWVTATAYVVGPPASFVSQAGAAYECLVAHTSGSFNTDLAAGKWGLVAAKGTDGAGTGDVVGPAGATDSSVAAFDGATGKLVKELTAAEVRTAAGATTVGSSLFTAADAPAALDSIAGAGVIRNQSFVASGTYTPHPKMLFCVIELVGGGGGGGGATGSTSQIYSGGGGGGGNYARTFKTKADIGASQSVTIGASGTGGSGSNNGGSGGNTSLGAIAVVTGGAGGTYGSGSHVPVGGSGFNPGLPGFYNAQNLTITFPSGAGGSGMFGGGAQGVSGSASSVANGVNGGGYGSGGSGGTTNNTTLTANGGNGSSGIVIITEYCSS